MSSAAGGSVVPQSGNNPTDLALRSYRQGDVLPELRSLAVLRMEDDGHSGFLARLLDRIPRVRAARTPLRTARLLRGGSLRWVEEPTPSGAVLISQTCDVVQSYQERPTVQAAKLIQLKNTMAQEAADGRRPRFVAVPNEGASWFADLEVIGTIHKLALVRLSHRAGILGDDQVRSFAELVGRRFSRFPFPDEVTEQTNALVKEVQGKYGKEASPLGQVLRQVLQLRLQANPRWDDPDAFVTLFVICNTGVLPTFDDPPDAPVDLAQWLRLNASWQFMLHD